MGFGPKLKEQMQWCGDHTEEISKLANTIVKGVMMENIEKGLDHGVKIELLDDKTENLRSQFAETNSSPGLPLPLQKIPSLPLWGVSPWSSAQTFPFHQTRGLTSTDKSHYTNHMKQTEPIVQNVPQWLSKVRLARFARFLTRGMKTA